MAELKTQRTTASVPQFLKTLEPARRKECQTLVALFRKVTGEPPRMWGTSIVGFGRYEWFGAGGKPVEWMITAFAPRKANLTVYLWPQFDGKQDLLAKLGKHSCGKGCLYIKRLSDVHVPTLTQLLDDSVKHARANRLGTKMA